MALLDEALTYILANTTGFAAGGAATSTQVPIYLSRMPPGVEDTAVSFYEPGGAPPTGGLSGTVPIVERPRIQVISRAPQFTTARNNAQRIWDAFYGLIEVDIAKTGSTGTTRWHTAEPVNSPTDIGRDSNERDMVTADYQIVKEMS